MPGWICKDCGNVCYGWPGDNHVCPYCDGSDLTSVEDVKDKLKSLEKVIEPHVQKILEIYKVAHGDEPLDGDETALLSETILAVMNKNEGNNNGVLSNPELMKIVFAKEDMRIPAAERRCGLYYYECRHRDNDWSTPMSIEPVVKVNFWGTIVTKTALNFPIQTTEGDRYIDLSEEDGEYIRKLSEGDADDDLSGHEEPPA